ncbi:MAG: hypothetical protein AAF732_20150 [Pseudomonadota bacterium]
MPGQTDLDLKTYLALQGLTPRPSQVWGSVRLVPLVRERVVGDLRLGLRRYDADFAAVAVKGSLNKPKLSYFSFIPHGLYVTWDDEPLEEVSVYSHFRDMRSQKDGRVSDNGWMKFQTHHRMVKQVASKTIRMFPQHLATEGLLAMHFGGPDVAYDYYSRRLLRSGMSPRIEYALPGEEIPDLADALRVFERYSNQCGVLVYVADALASAFVVPHPQDYGVLHKLLLENLYARLFYYYGQLYDGVDQFGFHVADADIASLDDLRGAFARATAEHAEFEANMTHDLLGRSVSRRQMYEMGPFELSWFLTDLREPGPQHVGEAIVRDNGTLEYLKTFRLDDDVARRAYWLDHIARHEWDVVAAAGAKNITPERLRDNLVDSGFEFMFREGRATRFDKSRR